MAKKCNTSGMASEAQKGSYITINIPVFPKIDHSGSTARIVLEQNIPAKKLPLTGIDPSTLEL